MHIAKCNIVIDTYLSKQKITVISKICMCKPINHAFDECSLNEHKVQNQHMKEMLSKAFNKKQTTQNVSSKQ